MAILINGEKYACASCIRGHRVKKCSHNDRPLLPIVKRGRQISQCNHCRTLRKTNGTHVKCTCAIASSPNPINGCLCEVINSCSCVASHLQEILDDNSSICSESPSVAEISLFSHSAGSTSCHYTASDASSQPFPSNLGDSSEPFLKPLNQQLAQTSLPEDKQVQLLSDLVPLIDDADLLRFLEHDLDDYITVGTLNNDNPAISMLKKNS